jgi:RNA-directed DNA polymerase
MMPSKPSSKVSRDQPKYVLDADIAGCFDHINHDALVHKLSSYPRLTQAVKAWLRAGVLEGNVFVETTSGTPQGDVISPLLANIALHGMETALIGAYPSGQQPHVVRYADDFVVLHPTEEGVQKAQARAAAWLADMGLEMKASKTRIAHTLYPIHGQAGFNFLGFTIRQFPVGKSQTGKDGHGKPLGFKTLIKPSQEKVKEHLRALGRTVHALKAASQEQVIGALNPQIVGWSHYYRSVVAKETFSDCDSAVYHIMRSWARRRHPNKNMHWIMGKYWAVDNHEGWKFKAATGYALKRHTATPIVRHIKVRGKASPYDGNLIYWAQRLRTHPLMHSTVGKLLSCQHGRCAWCGLYFRDGDLLEIDHIRPSSQGGTDVWLNLRVIHRHCHDQRHRTYEKGHTTEELDESKDSCPVLKTSVEGDSCV